MTCYIKVILFVKDFDGCELCSIHKDDPHVHWSTTLRGLDEWINWKKI